jgi:hypothetical protein
MKRKRKPTLGRKDKADFPEFELHDLDVKVDTGAYTSAIHCHHIETIKQAGQRVIRFRLLDPSHPQYEAQTYSTADFEERVIKNSFGKSERRYVIQTQIRLFSDTYPIELSLSERGEMKYPVLLGRKLLQGHFVIDVAKYDLSYRKKYAQPTD